jgi:hypothetical protein
VLCQPYQRGAIGKSFTKRSRRYITRPTIRLELLTIRTDGKIQYEPKNPYRGGRHRTEPSRRAVTYFVFTPERPKQTYGAGTPPRHNLVRHHDVFTQGCHQQNSLMRILSTPRKCHKISTETDQSEYKLAAELGAADQLIAPVTWTQRRDGEPIKRALNMMGPPRHITDPDIIQKLLDHIRAPPGPNHHRSNLRQLCKARTCLNKQPSHLCPTFETPK